MERITPFAPTRTFLTLREMPRSWKSGPVFFLNGAGGRARQCPLDYRQSCSQIATFVGLTGVQAGRILPPLSGRGCSPPKGLPWQPARFVVRFAPSLSCRKTFEESVLVRPESFPSRKTRGEL